MRLDHIDGIVMFVRAGIAGSFAEAARDAGVSPSAVSKAVGRLEATLGTKLFDRSTHAIRLTDDGRIYFEQCRGALEGILSAEESLRGEGSAPRGRLRVSASVPFARALLAPILPAFRTAYPALDVEIVATDRMSDLVEDRFDVVVRTGNLPDSGLVARKLIETRMIVAGAPDYLASRGTPRTVDELRGHDRLAFMFPQTGRHFDWFFDADPATRKIAPNRHLVFTDAASMIATAVAGGGLVFLQDYILAEAIAAGSLVKCLRPYSADGGPVSAVWLSSKHLVPKVRAFVDFLERELLKYREGHIREGRKVARESVPLRPAVLR